jgi:hypothetical protein
MSELTLSPNAIQAMQDAGWKYYAPRQWFERRYYQCYNAGQVAKDVSNYTGYEVFDSDMSAGEGYWYVALRADEECFDFAKRYDAYYDARQRIEHALFNNVLVTTKEQYEQLLGLGMVRDYEKRFIAGHVMIAIPDDAFTRQVIAILDALGM